VRVAFFLRYIVIYVVVAIVLLGLAAYVGFNGGMGALTWVAIGCLGLWIFGYHGMALWLDYRRFGRLLEQLRAGKLNGRIQPDHLRESIEHLAVNYGGVPNFVAAFLVQRVVTDDVARQLVAQISAHPKIAGSLRSPS
jgi:Na+(H+)/acetate symporter ActP